MSILTGLLVCAVVSAVATLAAVRLVSTNQYED